MTSSVYRNHKSAQASYDRLSRWYDFFTAGERAIQQQALSLLDPHPGESILEIGFGTGHNLVRLADLIGMNGLVAGSDLSGSMARRALSKLRKRSGRPGILLANADALYLPFSAAAFDAVISTFTLELFEISEIADVLDEIRRILKPGGRLVIASLNQPSRPNQAVTIYNWFHKTFPTLVDCRPIPVEQCLLASGFEIITSKNINLWGLPAQISASRKTISLFEL